MSAQVVEVARERDAMGAKRLAQRVEGAEVAPHAAHTQVEQDLDRLRLASQVVADGEIKVGESGIRRNRHTLTLAGEKRVVLALAQRGRREARQARALGVPG